MATWRKKLTDELTQHSESFSDIIQTTLTESQLNLEFDDGFGGAT